jgi:hypothetical protein
LRQADPQRMCISRKFFREIGKSFPQNSHWYRVASQRLLASQSRSTNHHSQMPLLPM